MAVLLLPAVLAMLLIGYAAYENWQTDRRQAELQPFYETTGLPASGPLGEIVRQEPLGLDVSNGEGFRVVYRTEGVSGQKILSSGMIFVPDEPAENRPVLAWAHGTLGLGEKCAPSRAEKLSDLAWLGDALSQGWVVTATDYAGFGTPGVQGYLIGKTEAHDVLNSVRAARNLPAANAGNEYVIWGHSQGGHSALFAASQARAYAPELDLKGTVAAAPAAELIALLDQQYDTAAAWVIGPIITATWPHFNGAINVNEVLTTEGQETYRTIAEQCIAQSALGGLARTALRQKIFVENPVQQAAWRQMAAEQSAPLLKANQPLMVVESKTDKVVLPNTTSLYIQQACAAGSNLQALWIDKGAHQDIPALTYPQVLPWIAERFQDKPNPSTCKQPPAVPPYGS